MTQPSTFMHLDRGAVRRVLGVFDLFAIGYGDLGSSIYYALGVTAFFALGATPLALALAGIVFACTALSYAEMSSIFQESGGSASYARHTFNDLISFCAGWGLLLDYIVTIAISAFTIAPYLIHFFPSLQQPEIQIGLTILLITTLTLLNIWGVKESTRISLCFMILTVLTQFLILGIGIFSIENFTTFFSHLTINDPHNPYSPSWDQFFKATAMAMVAYTGVESMAQLSAETKRPKTTVPKAILLTTGVILILYMGLSYIGFSLIDPYQMGHTYEQRPVMAIIEHLPWGASFLLPWMSVLAALTLFVAANAGLMGASRLSFNMGEYYQLPRFLSKLHPQLKTPYIALILFGVVACGVVALSQARLGFLADLYNFGAQIAFFSTHLSLLIHRIQHPSHKRPFKVPLNITIRQRKIPLPALLGALSSLTVWILIVITKPEGRILGCAWIACGLAMYYFYRKKKKIPATAQVSVEKIVIPPLTPPQIHTLLLPLKSSSQFTLLQIACELARSHNAHLTILHVIEVPFSLPLETPLPHRHQLALQVLKTAEAFARDYQIPFQLETVRARDVPDAIVQVAKERNTDLIVIEASSKTSTHLSKLIARPTHLWVYVVP